MEFDFQSAYMHGTEDLQESLYIINVISEWASCATMPFEDFVLIFKEAPLLRFVPLSGCKMNWAHGR